MNVESDYFGHGLVKPYTVDDVRVEGWWFLVGGGAGTINLNGEYHRGQERGGVDTRERIVPQRKTLKDFVEGFDLTSMARFDGVVGVPAGAFASALAEPGKQYALYLFHAKGDGQWGAHFVATPGTYRDTVTLKAVPAGRYRAGVGRPRERDREGRGRPPLERGRPHRDDPRVHDRRGPADARRPLARIIHQEADGRLPGGSVRVPGGQRSGSGP